MVHSYDAVAHSRPVQRSNNTLRQISVKQRAANEKAATEQLCSHL